MSRPEPARVVAPVRTAAVMTHRRREMTELALSQLLELAQEREVEVRLGRRAPSAHAAQR